MLADRAIARTRDPMTPRALTVAPESDVREAAQQMLYADVQRLFVTSEDRVIGEISTTDIVCAVEYEGNYEGSA